MKPLTLNGVKGLKLPEGFDISKLAGGRAVFIPDSGVPWFPDEPNDCRIVACLCYAHWQRQRAVLERQAGLWFSVAFPRKESK